MTESVDSLIVRLVSFSLHLCPWFTAVVLVRRWEGPASRWSLRIRRSWCIKAVCGNGRQPTFLPVGLILLLSLSLSLSLPLSPQLDCGIYPGLSGMDSLPYTDMIDADEIDLLLISQ